MLITTHPYEVHSLVLWLDRLAHDDDLTAVTHTSRGHHGEHSVMVESIDAVCGCSARVAYRHGAAGLLADEDGTAGIETYPGVQSRPMDCESCDGVRAHFPIPVSEASFWACRDHREAAYHYARYIIEHAVADLVYDDGRGPEYDPDEILR